VDVKKQRKKEAFHRLSDMSYGIDLLVNLWWKVVRNGIEVIA
jgi:hypothetical protein